MKRSTRISAGAVVARLALGMLLVVSVACGSDGGGGEKDVPIAPPDTVGEVATPDIAAPDALPADVPAPPATLALVGAFSGDGTTVHATFSAPLDAASLGSATFRVLATGGADGPAVASTTADGAEVAITLATPLGTAGPYTLEATGLAAADGTLLDPAAASATIKATLYLALVWHQHQPVYIDPEGDYLRGPWVRKHATKDYYDMAAILGDHPDVHVAVNLTPVLLMQLQKYYLDRIGPYVDLEANTIDVAGYFAQKPAGIDAPVTDPWVDMLLRDTPAPEAMTERERGWYYADIWSNFSISGPMLDRFLPYKGLQGRDDYTALTQADLLQLKGWFQLAWFDPDFLRGPVTLPDGNVVDLTDIVTANADGTFSLVTPFTEAICRRLVVEDYKIMKNVVAIHRQLAYDAEAKTGQIEVMTTPYYHPILPLLADTELAKVGMPGATLPTTRFQHPEDAEAQLAKATRMYATQFGKPVTGMWPAEGSVAEDVVGLFEAAGVRWVATDRRVLQQSTPADQPIYAPYRIDADDQVEAPAATHDDAIAIVFRDTEISDKIGFHYQGGTAEENVTDFLATLRKHAPDFGTGDRMLTVILDGENAWEWYRLDHDGKAFLHGIYTALEGAQGTGEFRTTTVSEYLSGNDARHIPAHPVASLQELEPLHAGSWINGNYDTWIGEDEENLAWDYLTKVRADLATFEQQGLARPDPAAEPPVAGTNEWYAAEAWETMYAAEGSDWFWWYGNDQTAVGGDAPFDRLFRELLRGVYRNAQLAGLPVEIPDFPPVLRVCRGPALVLSGEPEIDGVFDPDDGGDASKPNEWTDLGAGICTDIDSGAEANPNDDIGIYYHGTTADTLYVALRMNEDLTTHAGLDYQVRLYFSHKHITSLEDGGAFERDPALAATRTGDAIHFADGAAREVTLDLRSRAMNGFVAVPDGTAWGEPVIEPGIEYDAFANAGAPSIVEMKIPLSVLNYVEGDPLEMMVVVTEGGAELDRAPNVNSTIVFQDRTKLVAVTIVVDATGVRLALDAVKPLADFPPPEGTADVFIVGNQLELGNWTPNSVKMADDGATYGDETASDNFWTFEIVVPPLTDLQYKFTVGHEGEDWQPTEEYPLTNRGFIVTDHNGDLKMEIHDVFADRPDPSGAIGEMSVMVND